MRRALWDDCPEDQQLRELGELLSSDAEIAFVAERPGGELCGFVEVSIRPRAIGCEPRPVGYIEGWYVDPDVRRLGIGAALVHAAEEWARSQECRQMASDAHIDNAVSIEAHGHLGYRGGERLVHFTKDLG